MREEREEHTHTHTRRGGGENERMIPWDTGVEDLGVCRV